MEALFYYCKNTAWPASAWKRLVPAFVVALCCVLPVAAENVLFAPDPARTGAESGVWSASLTEPGRRNAAVIPVPVDSIAGKKVLLAAEVEQRDISEKPNHWNGVKQVLELTYADGKKDYPQALNAPGSLPWMPRAVSVTVPPDIRSARITLGLESVSGTVRFRNVRILEDIPVDHGQCLWRRGSPAASSGCPGSAISVESRSVEFAVGGRISRRPWGFSIR